MFDTFLRAVCVSRDEWGFMWVYITPHFATLLNEESHASLKQAAILASPYLPWLSWGTAGDKRLIQQWAAAARAVPSADEVDQSIADTLLQIASDHSLRPHIPIGTWSLLNRRPSLPPACHGRTAGTCREVVRTVRALGDAEILTSYLILVWSEWNWLISEEIRDAMSASTREDLSGIGMRLHREDLLHRLDQVLGQFDLGFTHLQQRNPTLKRYHVHILLAKKCYKEFKEVVSEVDREATHLLTRELLISIILSPY